MKPSGLPVVALVIASVVVTMVTAGSVFVTPDGSAFLYPDSLMLATPMGGTGPVEPWPPTATLITGDMSRTMCISMNYTQAGNVPPNATPCFLADYGTDIPMWLKCNAHGGLFTQGTKMQWIAGCLENDVSRKELGVNLQDGVERHLCVTYNNTAKRLVFYMNAQQVWSGPSPNAAYNTAHDASPVVRCGWWADRNAVEGCPRISTRALMIASYPMSASEIARTYDSTRCLVGGFGAQCNVGAEEMLGITVQMASTSTPPGIVITVAHATPPLPYFVTVVFSTAGNTSVRCGGTVSSTASNGRTTTTIQATLAQVSACAQLLTGPTNLDYATRLTVSMWYANDAVAFGVWWYDAHVVVNRFSEAVVAFGVQQVGGNRGPVNTSLAMQVSVICDKPSYTPITDTAHCCAIGSGGLVTVTDGLLLAGSTALGAVFLVQEQYTQGRTCVAFQVPARVTADTLRLTVRRDTIAAVDFDTQTTRRRRRGRRGDGDGDGGDGGFTAQAEEPETASLLVSFKITDGTSPTTTGGGGGGGAGGGGGGDGDSNMLQWIVIGACVVLIAIAVIVAVVCVLRHKKSAAAPPAPPAPAPAPATTFVDA